MAKFAEFTFPEGGCIKGQHALTARLDVIQAEGSFAVTQGIVVAVYGLHLVVTRPAIYVVQPVGVARVDKVVAVAGVHLVVAVTGDDLVVAATAFDLVVAAATLEAIFPVGPHERVVAGAGEDLRQGFVPGEERSDHHYHHRQQDV
jgi:hypothetical protein